MEKERSQKLFEVADRQSGFFTSEQAKQAGYRKNHIQFVRSRKWERSYRGIYRLAHYPRVPRPDLMIWFLWSRRRGGGPEGVYSHQTALTLYELSDVMPTQIHMTVPRKFRRSAPIPGVLTLYRRDLPRDDVRWLEGVKVTTPLRTLVDIIVHEPIEEEFIWQAVGEALERGLIIAKDEILTRIESFGLGHLSADFLEYLHESDSTD